MGMRRAAPTGAESDVAVLRSWRNQVDDGAFSGNGRTIKISSDIRESRNACRASPRACRSGAFDGVLVRFRHGPSASSGVVLADEHARNPDHAISPAPDAAFSKPRHAGASHEGRRTHSIDRQRQKSKDRCGSTGDRRSRGDGKGPPDRCLSIGALFGPVAGNAVDAFRSCSSAASVIIKGMAAPCLGARPHCQSVGGIDDATYRSANLMNDPRSGR